MKPNHELNMVRKVGLKFSPTPLPVPTPVPEVEVDDGIEMGEINVGIKKPKSAGPKVTKVKRIG